MNSDYYVLLNDEHSLWCSRSDGTFTPKSGKSKSKELFLLLFFLFYALIMKGI